MTDEKQKFERTPEQLKQDVDLAVDECIAAINKAKGHYEDKTVRMLVQHRVVNAIWFCINRPVLEMINHQGFMFQEIEAKK